MDELLDFDFDGQKGEGIVKLSKSAEEIEALVVPDDTPELERLALFLANGQKVQKESVVLNLARTLRAYRAEAFDRLMPILTVRHARMRGGHLLGAELCGSTQLVHSRHRVGWRECVRAVRALFTACRRYAA